MHELTGSFEPALGYRALTGDGAARLPEKRAHEAAGLLGAMSIFAHDLRGPLANLGVLLEGMEMRAERQSAAAIADAARKAQSIIQALDDLLTEMLTRVRRTGDPLHVRPRTVELDTVLDAAVALSLPLAESRKVTIRCPASETLTVQGDEQLLVQALDNLINNAVKHAPPGSTVCCVQSREAELAVLRISNDGPGLTDADVQSAFRPFTRLSQRADGARASFGLGLWIVRLILERHGGSISAARRDAAGGSVFTVSLPLAEI